MKSYRWFVFRYVLGFDANEAMGIISMLQPTSGVFDSFPTRFLTSLGVPIVSESIYTYEELDKWYRRTTKIMLPKVKNSNLYKIKRCCYDIRRLTKTI